MFAFRPSACWLKEGGKAGLKSKHTQQAIKQHLAKHGKKLERSSKLPVIPTCPEPTCECADMPGDLDIEREKDLNGTMAAYSQQILISTGQADWQSRIEDEKDTAPWGTVVAGIKEMLGPKGRFHDVCYFNTCKSLLTISSAISKRGSQHVLVRYRYQPGTASF